MHRAGDGKRSLIGKDSPALWYEALAALPPLPPVPANMPPPSEAKVDICTSRVAAASRSCGMCLLWL